MEISCNMVQTLRWKLKVTVRPMQVMLVIRTHLNQMSNHYWRLKKSRGTLLMSTMRPQIMRRQRRRRKDVLSAAVVLIKYYWKFKLQNAFNFMNLSHFCSSKIKHKAAIWILIKKWLQIGGKWNLNIVNCARFCKKRTPNFKFGLPFYWSTVKFEFTFHELIPYR